MKNNNKIISEGKYDNNLPVEIWKYYFENGKIETIVEYRSNKGRSDFSGIYIEYYSNGKIKTEGRYKLLENDSLECVECYDVTSCIECFNSINSRKIKKTTNWPLKDGIWKEYYESGNLKTVGSYYSGVHETQNVNTIVGTKFKSLSLGCQYLKHKEWKCYDENGNHIRTEYYFKGILIGEETF
jgi:antitoxin component YwqK of YwqJK toxin-antitoxin module